MAELIPLSVNRSRTKFPTDLELSGRLDAAVSGAVGFLERNRNGDGLWSDFVTMAGESVCWVSGYVGHSLATCRSTAVGSIEEAGRKVLARQRANGGWGYGEMVPPDADSTAWCLLFLSELGVQGDESREGAVKFLLRHQNPSDGGFRTYAAPRDVARYMKLDGETRFDGWSSSQVCVTAVAAKALAGIRPAPRVDGALDCVRRSQCPDGSWNPYWWSERLYPTSHCLELLAELGGEADETLVRRGAEWIARTQRPEGSWSEAPSMRGVPFSTALALKGLMAARGIGHSDVIERGAEWLIASQMADGGWAGHHILRIPHPATTEPWKQDEWRRDGTAIGALIMDHRRLFTTATALSALSQLLSWSGGGGG